MGACYYINFDIIMILTCKSQECDGVKSNNLIKFWKTVRGKKHFFACFCPVVGK